ncbi:MAG: peptidase MA family metallohydrolase [Chloroflexota bacterium]
MGRCLSLLCIGIAVMSILSCAGEGGASGVLSGGTQSGADGGRVAERLVMRGPHQATGEASRITVLDTSVEARFPSALVFKLEAESEQEIVDARLLYRVERMNYAEVTSEAWADVSPSRHVETSWTWDMRRSSLPPETVVHYRWSITDALGNRQETAEKTVTFEDTRYDWQRMTEGRINLFWYSGDDAFAGELMEACQDGLDRLVQDMGVSPQGEIDLYIYASSDDLQGAMIFPQEWTGGAAFTEFGTIAIGIAPDRLAWGKRAIVHELTHLVVHQATFNPYSDLPRWLDEGLAMYNEGELAAGFVTHLEKAVVGGNLISVRTLCSGFSAHPERAYLAYAQSYSLVEYLLSEHGHDSMLELLDVFGAGSTYDGALEEVYGFDIEGLDRRWREYVGEVVEVEKV